MHDVLITLQVVSIIFGQLFMVLFYFPKGGVLHLNKMMYVSGNSKWKYTDEHWQPTLPWTCQQRSHRVSASHAAAVRLASTNKTLAAISLR